MYAVRRALCLMRPSSSSSKISPSMILAPCADILSKVLSLPGDPLLWGMAVSLVCCLIGFILGSKKRAD